MLKLPEVPRWALNRVEEERAKSLGFNPNEANVDVWLASPERWPDIYAFAAYIARTEFVEIYQIGDRVEIMPYEFGIDWQGDPPQFIAGIDWHPKHGVTYTTSETWPPKCEGTRAVGLTDEWTPLHLRRIAKQEGGQ